MRPMTLRNPMSEARSHSRAPFLALAGLLSLLVLTGCGDDAQAGEEGRTASGAESGEGVSTRVINVETLELTRGPFTETVRIAGTVQANRDVVVSAEESGVIRQLLVEKGAVVQAGQPLARIDDALLASQVREAEARAQLARETWDRRKRLYEEDGVGNELAYLEARYSAEQTEAAVETLQERLDRTVIRAPISGILEDREVEVGTMVSAGTPVFRVVEVDPVKVTGGVPERFAAEIRRGTPARVTFDVLRDEEFHGEVTYVGSTVNPRNRTFPMELTVPNRGQVVKPEMVANVSLTRRELEDVVVIPQDAVVRVEEGYVAFVVVEQDGQTVAQRRPLTILATQRNQVVVEEGLEAGDRLIVVGQQQVAQGDRVQVVRSREMTHD
jgi:membrane fusion protein, multidrug efflux system